MKTATIIVMIVVFANLSVSASSRLEILTPPEHAGTKLDRLHVVGTTNAPIVEVYLNGELTRAIAVRDSIFHTLLSFGYGLNEVVVTTVPGGPGNDNAVADTVEILSGPQIENKYGRLFTALSFHSDQPHLECLGCHQPSPSETAVVDDAKLCYECHREIQLRFRTHIPDDRQACINCHKMHADLTAVSTGSYTDKNPCYLCHKDKIGAYAQNYIHGPVAGGTCTICHDPHGSVYEKSLVSPVPVLCPSCHELADSRELTVQHRPFAEGRCSDCHDPHSTDHKWVLVKGSQELCTNCHREMGSLQSHQHPYNVEPKRPLSKSLQLSDKGQLECLSCHESHACKTEHLLRSDQANTCSGCHPDY